MTTAYTSLLGLALPVTGELSGTWGDTVNTAITSLLDTAVAGTTSITVDADITLTTTSGASNQARQAIILWNPASGTVTRNITAPAQSKLYTVINASGGTQSIVIRGVGPTTGVTIAKGESAQVAWNGSDFVKVGSSGGAATFTNLTVTGNTILGDAAADTLTVNATVTSNLIFTDNTYDIGASGATRPRSLFLGTNLTVGSLTSTRVPYASTGGLLVDSANMTFNGTRLTVADLADSGLTSGRVTYASSGGALTDSANLTFDGTNLTATNSIFVGGGSTSAVFNRYWNASGYTFIGVEGAAGGAIATGTDAYAAVFASSTTNKLQFAPSGTLAATFDNVGRFGIGTSSPSVRLQVEEAANSAAITLLRLNNSGTTGGGPGIASRISFTASATSLGFIQGSNFASGEAGLQFSGDGSTVQATFNGSGSFLIGRTSVIGTNNRLAIQMAGTSASGYTAASNAALAIDAGTSTNCVLNLVGGGDMGVFRTNSSNAYDVGISFGDNSTRALSFTTANAERARIDTSGRFLIGITSGSYALDVGDVSGGNMFRFTRSGVELSGFISSGTPFFGSTTNNALALMTNGTERARIDTTGRLGVGTTSFQAGSPAGSISFPQGASVQTGSFGRAWNPAQQIGQASNAGLYGMAQTYLAYYDSGWKSLGGGTASAITLDEGVFSFSNTNGVGASGSALTWTTRMMIGTNGRVGIGTVSPQTLLHVNTGDNAADVIRVTNGTLSLNLGVNSSAGGSYLYEATANALRLGTNNAERARIDGSGNVMVNTTSPISGTVLTANGRIGTNRQGSSVQFDFYSAASSTTLVTMSGPGDGSFCLVRVDYTTLYAYVGGAQATGSILVSSRYNSSGGTYSTLSVDLGSTFSGFDTRPTVAFSNNVCTISLGSSVTVIARVTVTWYNWTATF